MNKEYETTASAWSEARVVSETTEANDLSDAGSSSMDSGDGCDR